MKPWLRQEEQPRHADDWLITYADMITLLLCFFVVFVIVSTGKKDAPHKPPARQVVATEAPVTPPPAPKQEDIQTTVKLPDVFQTNLPFHKLGPADFSSDDPSPVNDAEKTPPPDPIQVSALVPPAPENVPVAKIDAPPAPAPADTNPPMSGNTDPEQKGNRLTTIEINSAAFFDSGSAVLSTSGKVILQDVASKLKSDEFRNYQITVEGHTDDTPIHTAQFPSNWELSTSRAAAVVHSLLDLGIPAQKLRAIGYADMFPKVPNRDTNGNPIPHNQMQNRRVVIKLEKIDKEP